MSNPNREQWRAGFAYEAVSKAHRDQCWSKYQGVVMGLSVVILRCGLVGAVAWLHRQSKAGELVRQQLGEAGVSGLKVGADELLPRVCALGLPQYMVATREVLKVAGWLERAVQAMPDAEGGVGVGDHA